MYFPPICEPGDFSYTPHTPEDRKAHQDALDAKLLADANALDAAYASVEGRAEQFNKDLLALVTAARAVTNGAHFGSPAAMKQAHGFLAAALDTFEPWLDDSDDDPRADGWVDDKGRP